MALWGTSLSGGHVIVTAAQTPGISAIVAQVPFVDGRSSPRSFGFKLQAVLHGLWDVLGAALLDRRHYVPIVGDPNTFAMMNTPDALEGAKKLLPQGAKPGRKCPAVIALTGAFYRSIKYAPDFKCPAPVIHVEQGTLISPDTTKSTAKYAEGDRVRSVHQSFRPLRG